MKIRGWDGITDPAWMSMALVLGGLLVMALGFLVAWLMA